MSTKWAFAYGLVIGLLGTGLLLLVARQPSGKAITLLPPPSPVPILVHVSGAVNQPGVYALPIGSRVQDALQAAGGARTDAASEMLNLAAPLQDGMQVLIPSQQDTASFSASQTGQPGLSISQLTPSVAIQLININTASQEVLESLPGIGPVLAQRIIDYRASHGSFASIEDVLNVPGIGLAIYEQIKGLISVEG